MKFSSWKLGVFCDSRLQVVGRENDCYFLCLEGGRNQVKMTAGFHCEEEKGKAEDDLRREESTMALRDRSMHQ